MFKRILSLAAVLVLSTSLAAQALPIDLTLTPNSDLTGTKGATVGWGFTITNNSTDWIVLTGSTFTSPSTWGKYYDFVAYLANSTIAPNGTVNSSFFADPSDTVQTGFYHSTGTGKFVIDTQPPLYEQTAPGTITISFDQYADEALFEQLLPSSSVSALASVTATDTTAVPEPSTCLLVGMGLGALLYARKKMQKQF